MGIKSGEIASLFARVGLKTDDAKQGANELSSLLRGIGSTFKTAIAAIAVGATVRAGFRELAEDVRLAAEESAGIASLGQAIRNTGADWSQASEEIERYLAAEAKRAALDDGEGRESIARLTAATKDYRSALALLPVAQDLARAKKIDLVNASEILSKVAAGNTSILTRYGIVLDENATAEEAIAELRRRYAGQAEAYARTQLGQQERMNIALGNIRETVGGGLNPAMTQFYSLAATALEGILPMVEKGAEAFSDMLLGWTRSLAGFARDAAYWGANVVEQFASGIEGSGAVSSALRNMGDQIAAWLTPGSPPKLLPDLADWGAGAAAAYLEGWQLSASDIDALMQDTAKSLEPWLAQLRGGALFGDIEAGAAGAFGGRFGAVSGYLEAYSGLQEAIRDTAAAQAEYDEAMASGDETAIEGAETRLEQAQDREARARREADSERQRMQSRLALEAALTRALEQQSKAAIDRSNAEGAAAAAAAQREAEAEAKRAAAEAKRIHDAKLAYELATTDTAGQIELWKRELGEAAEGSAEYWNIMTRIATLQRQLQDEGARGGLGAGWAAGTEDLIDTEQMQEDVGEAIDWSGIGKAIAKALWDGIRERTNALMLDWARDLVSGENLRAVAGTGADWGRALARGLVDFLRGPQREATSAEMGDHIESGSEALANAFAEVARTAFTSFWTSWSTEMDKAGGLWGLIFTTPRAEQFAEKNRRALEGADPSQMVPATRETVPTMLEAIDSLLGGTKYQERMEVEATLPPELATSIAQQSVQNSDLLARQDEQVQLSQEQIDWLAKIAEGIKRPNIININVPAASGGTTATDASKYGLLGALRAAGVQP